MPEFHILFPSFHYNQIYILTPYAASVMMRHLLFAERLKFPALLSTSLFSAKLYLGHENSPSLTGAIADETGAREQEL